MSKNIYPCGTPPAMCDGLCQNGGTCVSPNNCICQQGFTGKRCETGKTSSLSSHLKVILLQDCTEYKEAHRRWGVTFLDILGKQNFTPNKKYCSTRGERLKLKSFEVTLRSSLGYYLRFDFTFHQCTVNNLYETTFH